MLNFALHELARHPEVYENLVTEIDSVLGPADGIMKFPTAKQMEEEMPYMEMVLNEVLRIYPPAGGTSRTVPETFEYKGFIFPKGMNVAPSIFLMHRNPEFWPEPEKFDPERFTKANSEGRPLYAFFPFSAGSRICIGKKFFNLEAKSVLATLLRVVKIEADPLKTSGEMSSISGLLKPKSVWIKISPREGANGHAKKE